jgi:hypothetical protein
VLLVAVRDSLKFGALTVLGTEDEGICRNVLDKC